MVAEKLSGTHPEIFSGCVPLKMLENDWRSVL
jgi:hypothetical protein